MAKYRIDFTIQQRVDSSGEYLEIGFGSGSGGSIESAAYDVETILQRREWETEPGMPDPDIVEPEE